MLRKTLTILTLSIFLASVTFSDLVVAQTQTVQERISKTPYVDIINHYQEASSNMDLLSAEKEVAAAKKAEFENLKKKRKTHQK